jgi:hypothetical protein
MVVMVVKGLGGTKMAPEGAMWVSVVGDSEGNVVVHVVKAAG